jgi:hypothetical protein
MKKQIKVPEYETAKYVPLSVIVPDNWKSWFYDAISLDAPFSWGDNNRTLVDAISFGHHAEERIDMEESFGNIGTIKGRKSFFSMLDQLEKEQIYIDLEN